jgi:hypothetical protein
MVEVSWANGLVILVISGARYTRSRKTICECRIKGSGAQWADELVGPMVSICSEPINPKDKRSRFN